MIERVVEGVLKVGDIQDVFVLTDDQRIMDVLLDTGAIPMLTSADCRSGTERILSVCEKLDADIVLNIQGDEPMINAHHIQSLINLMKVEQPEIGTLCHKITDNDSLFDFNKVKVVFNNLGKVMYFSRQAIPAHRDKAFKDWFDSSAYYQHIGVYGYKMNVLRQLKDLESSNLESSEQLEQLNWMYNGHDVHIVEVEQGNSISVDTEKDYKAALKLFKSQSGGSR
jgi:3-deoxy-manno-octulosonate cytidylyltransferase (CMP-KDO synthetase)